MREREPIRFTRRRLGNGVFLGGLVPILALTASCAGAPEREAPLAPKPPASAPAAAAPESAAPNLASVPPEANVFLADLRSHVRRGDWAWGADRADPSFLRAMEGRARDAYFYTCLFAAGSLSREDEVDYGRFNPLPLAKVRDMVWEDARVEGPVVEVRGRFIIAQGKPVPFTVRVLWRLDPPRILGVQP